MTKTVEEARRAAFEHAYSKMDQQAAQHLLFVRDDGQYGYHTTRTAWACFNAALDAVEIQLPSERKIRHMPTPNENQSYNEALENCKDAIEQTGLGLRIK